MTTDNFGNPLSLVEAVNEVIYDKPAITLAGFRRDLDVRPLYLLAGLQRTLNEVYFGSAADFPEDETEEARIHDLLKIVPATNHIKYSLSHYGGSGSRDINHYLWEHHLHGSQIPNHIKQHIENLDNAVLKRTDTGPAKLYTGVSVSPATTAGIEWNSIRPIKLLHLPAFTSTSTNFDTAAWFTTPDEVSNHHESDHQGIILPNARHIIELNFSKAIPHALSMLGHGGAGNEREILLGRDHQFELSPKPTLVHDYGQHPLYVWKAIPGPFLPRPKKL